MLFNLKTFFSNKCEWRKKFLVNEGFLLILKNYKFKYWIFHNKNKLKNLHSIFLHVSETVHFVLIDKSSIEGYEKEDYGDDLVKSISNEEDSNINDSENIDIEL